MVDKPSKWPPRGDFLIPCRGDYSSLRTAAPISELVEIVKTQVDYARMCLENERADMATESLRTIWSYVDAIGRRSPRENDN